jgi:hypothetical protein
MASGDKLQFAFPSEIGFGILPKCLVDGSALQSIDCVKVDRKFEAELIFFGDGIGPNEVFNFKIT